ncbi:MAG: hybrid sensor histidine kinase/response regulator [Deltaproteobacteria bacterium]|nr:hybrid sensor histidine kinase/response regulator [Deltaproteobacteria bacterium]
MTPVKKQGKSNSDLFEIVERAKYFWESTFDAIVNPVMVIDKQYKIERANVALAKSAGQGVQKLIGNKCYNSFAGRNSPCPSCPLEETRKTKASAISQLRKFKDGREYQAVSFPLKGNKKDLDLFILQYRDIREEKQLQAKLLQSEKMAAIGLLAGGVAHEINNPLGGILAFCQLALQQSKAGTQIFEDLKEIESSALRCKKIVENLLAFSRQSSDEYKRERSLQRVFEKVLPLISLQCKEHGITLKTDFAKKLPPVSLLENQLEQVFLNLVSNACHASPRGSAITIKAKPFNDNTLLIQVIDQGSGIKKEFLNRIFDPFFTTKKVGLGTGLGLSISYSIIQDHGGKIEVESKENEGSTFSLYLPLHTP